MKYGATNHPFHPVTNEIRFIASMGFDYLELCLDPPNCIPEKLFDDWREIKNVLDGEGLQLPVVHLPTFVWLADMYPSIREASLMEIYKALDFTREIGVRKAVLHPGYITGLLSFSPNVGKMYALESLDLIIRRAEELGIVICLENLFPKLGNFHRPEEFSAVLTKYPSLMVTLDLGHASLRAPKEQIQSFVSAVMGRIGHVHVADNNGRDDEHLPIGVGRVDLVGGLRAIKATGYDDTLTLEVFAPDREYLGISLRKVKSLWEQLSVS
ncbi:MAG: sugar phosphate isomerase/epimerase [Syntrophales bacterium]|nr:sugar phosphate isomerase/epimerase [Syntrophales bacterium]